MTSSGYKGCYDQHKSYWKCGCHKSKSYGKSKGYDKHKSQHKSCCCCKDKSHGHHNYGYYQLRSWL